MNKQKLKLVTIYSLILGAVLGAIALLPYIQILALVTMAVVSSVLVILYMEKRGEIGDLTIKGGAILGIIVGFISLAGFLIVFLPINAILGLIFSGVTDYFAFSKYLLQIWWILLFMGGIVTALFNSFALISYVYIRDTFFMIDGKKEIKGDFIQRDRKNGF